MAKRKSYRRGPQLKLAGALCVAFVNTAGASKKNRQRGVGSYEEMVVWAQQAGVTSALEAERLSRLAAERPADAEAVFGRAMHLRHRLTRLFSATARQRELPADDLAAFNGDLARAFPALRLVPAEKGGLTWGWGGDEDALDRMLWPVVRSAAELLVSMEGRPQVRQCAAPDCTLFFVDRSPSGQKKWCRMKPCGNRVKSLRHYRRFARIDRQKRHVKPKGKTFELPSEAEVQAKMEEILARSGSEPVKP